METINKMKNFAIVFLFLAFIFAWLNIQENFEIKYVSLAGTDVKVEVANTIKSRTQGLSRRESLPTGEGMLFVFDRPAKYHFWMKDMNFPIDIIWISEDFKVTHVKENATPESYPESFGPYIDSRYVLEVNVGFAKKYQLKVGDFVKFSK